MHAPHLPAIHIHHWHYGAILSSLGSLATAAGLLLTRQQLVRADASGFLALPVSKGPWHGVTVLNNGPSAIWDITVRVRDSEGTVRETNLFQGIVISPQGKETQTVNGARELAGLSLPLFIGLDFTDSNGRRWRRRYKHAKLVRRRWWTRRT